LSSDRRRNRDLAQHLHADADVGDTSFKGYASYQRTSPAKPPPTIIYDRLLDCIQNTGIRHLKCRTAGSEIKLLDVKKLLKLLGTHFLLTCG